MKTIWKFPLAVTDVQTIEMPVGAKVLPFVSTGAPPALRVTIPLFIWAEVDPDAPDGTRTFYVVGTGSPIPDGAGQYVGTCLQGSFVWHCYEGTRS